MSDDWDFFFLLVDDQPASIFVDLGIATEAPIARYSHMGYVRVTMLHPRDDGLSSQEEFEDLRDLEDAIVPEIAPAGAIFVGRNTSDGHRDFYFYAADPDRFVARAETALQRHPAYRCEVGTRPDPDWSTYFDFLSPSPDDWQRIMNRRVRNGLEQHGDALDVPRPIDHRAYFPTGEGAAAFIGRAERVGFRVELPKPMAEGDYVVDLVRDDSPDDMDDVAVTLARLARELGGTYDGWGCTVIPAAG